MRDPYGPLAPMYDRMARDPGIQSLYRRWRETLEGAAREHGIRGRVLVDLACGTGNSTIPWSRKRGWTVIGVDRSAAMLRVARSKSKAVRWIRQDLVNLDLGVQADFVTCHFDALNHILDTGDLQRVFERVGTALRPGGLFQFDLNTLEWLQWLSGRDKLFTGAGHVFTAFNSHSARTGITTMNQLWFVRRGRVYERRLVSVRERAFTDGTIKRLLGRGGMRLLRIEPQGEIEGKVMRKLYLAEKRQATVPVP